MPNPPDDPPVAPAPSAGEDDARARVQAATPGPLDEVGEASFPASDPPATWTWDVEVSRPP